MVGDVTLLVLALFFMTDALGATSDCGVTQATTKVIRSSVEEYEFNAGVMTLRGIVIGERPRSVIWTRNGKVVTTGSIYGGHYNIKNTMLNTNPFPPCTTNQWKLDVIITGYLPGNYTLYASDHNYNISSSTIIEESAKPKYLVLEQLRDLRILASWTAPLNKVVGYRVFINDDDYIIGGGNSVTVPSYVYSGSRYGEQITFRIRAITNHYWSEVLGPQTIEIKNISEPIVYTIFVSSSTATLLLSQSKYTLSANQYLVNWTTSSECSRIDNKFKVYSTNLIQLKNVLENCTYKVDIKARNTMAELQSTSSTRIEFKTKASQSKWNYVITSIPFMMAIFIGNLTIFSVIFFSIYFRAQCDCTTCIIRKIDSFKKEDKLKKEKKLAALYGSNERERHTSDANEVMENAAAVMDSDEIENRSEIDIANNEHSNNGSSTDESYRKEGSQYQPQSKVNLERKDHKISYGKIKSK